MKKQICKNLIGLRTLLDLCSQNQYSILFKRLSVTDTDTNGTHQSGPLIPQKFIHQVIPELFHTDSSVAKLFFSSVLFPQFDEHTEFQNPCLSYYRSKSETRLTGFKGESSPFKSSAGKILVFAVDKNSKDTARAFAWITEFSFEEDLIENFWLSSKVSEGSGSVIQDFSINEPGTVNWKHLIGNGQHFMQ